MFKSSLKALLLLSLFYGNVQANSEFLDLEKPYTTSLTEKNHIKSWSANGLIILPEAKKDVFIEAINSAKKEIYISCYKLSDPDILKAIEQVL